MIGRHFSLRAWAGLAYAALFYSILSGQLHSRPLLARCASQDVGAARADVSGAAVGVPAWLRDLVIDGPEVEVEPGDHTTAMVLRIGQVFPHGSGFRYDIEYYGLEPGAFDLRDYLRRKDGSSLEDAAPIPVVIESSLPAGELRPNALESQEVPAGGSYAVTMWLLGLLWVAVLVAILIMGRKRRSRHFEEHKRPRTLADRLRPLVEQGIAGELSAPDCAELELVLIAYWRQKLDLSEFTSVDALRTIKSHGEAGPLLRQLERWLHDPASSDDVDIAALLAPYQDVSADVLGEPKTDSTSARVLNSA